MITKSKFHRVLVTGGAGFIGSHTVLALLESGFEVVILDNLCNSSFESVKRIAMISGCEPTFIRGDIRNRPLLKDMFAQYSFDAVLHFAGLKAVGESVLQPLRYYDNNVHGTQILLESMIDAGILDLCSVRQLRYMANR